MELFRMTRTLLVILALATGITSNVFAAPLDAAKCAEYLKLTPEYKLAVDLVNSLETAATNRAERKNGVEQLYHTKGLSQEALTHALTESLVIKSDLLKAELSKSKSIELRTYDFIYVGAGIHSAIVKSSFNHGLDGAVKAPRVLTIEATREISVFGRTGKSFRGNTLEHAEIGTREIPDAELKSMSRNIIPNAPIQVSDVAKTVVPNAVEFQRPAVAAHWAEPGDFLFESPVVTYEKVRAGPRAGYYRVVMADGETVYAKELVLSTGVGKEKLPSKDPASIKFIESENKKKNPHVVFVETQLENAQRDSDHGVNFTTPYANADVIILGGGHGGAIGIEALEGLGPKALYDKFGGVSKVKKPKGYLWVNMKADTGEEFKKAIGGGTRYYELAPLIDIGRIKTNRYYVNEVLPGDTKAVKISYTNKETGLPVLDGNGKTFYQEADYVIYAVGYEPINAKLAAGFGTGMHFEPVAAKITPNDTRLVHDVDVTVATRLVAEDGTVENIYAAGPSAGQIPHEKDPGGKTSVTINIFGPRSEGFGNWLREKFLRENAKVAH